MVKITFFLFLLSLLSCKESVLLSSPEKKQQDVFTEVKEYSFELVSLNNTAIVEREVIENLYNVLYFYKNTSVKKIFKNGVFERTESISLPMDSFEAQGDSNVGIVYSGLVQNGFKMCVDLQEMEPEELCAVIFYPYFVLAPNELQKDDLEAVVTITNPVTLQESDLIFNLKRFFAYSKKKIVAHVVESVDYALPENYDLDGIPRGGSLLYADLDTKEFKYITPCSATLDGLNNDYRGLWPFRYITQNELTYAIGNDVFL